MDSAVTVQYDSVPPTLRRYRVPADVLRSTQAFLRQRGAHGLEAVVLWLGVVTDPECADVISELIPEQIAYRTEDGVAVSIPDEVVAEIIRGMPPGVVVLCRVHSHPGSAYHS